MTKVSLHLEGQGGASFSKAEMNKLCRLAQLTGGTVVILDGTDMSCALFPWLECKLTRMKPKAHRPEAGPHPCRRSANHASPLLVQCLVMCLTRGTTSCMGDSWFTLVPCQLGVSKLRILLSLEDMHAVSSAQLATRLLETTDSGLGLTEHLWSNC